MKYPPLLPFVIITIVGTAWCMNLYKLTQCDFAPSWRGEIIHALGLFPPAAIVTMWCDAK